MESPGYLVLDGEPICAEAIECILDALDLGVRMAKRINKVYMPKNV